MKTKLKDRILWFDGTNEICASDISAFIMKYPSASIAVDVLTPEMLQFNKFVSSDNKIHTKTQNKLPNIQWNLKKDYVDTNVQEYILNKLEQEIITNSWDLDSTMVLSRTERVVHELRIFEKHGMFDLIRVLIYIINTLDENKQVWGVGRGSSVSSYVLYLIGVHDVDSVLYNIEFTDFIQE